MLCDPSIFAKYSLFTPSSIAGTNELTLWRIASRLRKELTLRNSASGLRKDILPLTNVAKILVPFRHRAKAYTTLAERAVFVSGRDAYSTRVLAGVLRDSEDPMVQPDDVVLVRDPVLSDKTLTDTTGACWKQSEGRCTSSMRLVPCLRLGCVSVVKSALRVSGGKRVGGRDKNRRAARMGTRAST